ncbi:hypothetical protein BJY01DRAFT_250083 [Aspergillus pseudoustus]|uniref:Uncharacterized protein n=1 Tax=Aspergillus pseudoustus TaxID=1810923 RepID=A0ABR4JKN5_9EURO
MPVPDYGMWKGIPILYEFENHQEDPKSPHLSLYYHDNSTGEPVFDPTFRRRHRGRPPSRERPREIPGLFRAAINIKSVDEDTRLAYWVDRKLADHRPKIVNSLKNEDFGFHPIKKLGGLNGKGLDYLRGNLFDAQSGRVLPHDIPGPNNDLIDVLEPEIKEAIRRHAKIYIFGSMFNTKNGIHNVHMNQGNIENFTKDDGVYQDGGLLIEYDDHWTGVFLAFASQATKTDDDGHRISDNSPTWGESLLSDTGDNL